jgi:hypothetical protein
MAIKSVRNIMPLPKEWEGNNNLRQFGIRINDAFRELFGRRVARIKAGSTVLNSDENDTVTLGSAATYTAANNLITTVTGRVLDARQGKVLNDSKIDKMPSYVTVPANSNMNAVLESGHQYLIMLEGSGANTRTVIVATLSSNGTVYATQLIAASNLTISYTTNRIRVANATSSSVRIHLIDFTKMEG